MKVLYLYAGIRADKFSGTPGVDFPDTQFYGFNYLKDFDIDADYEEPDTLVPRWLLRLPFGFRLAHFLSFFHARSYDIVFGSALLYTLFWKKVIPTKTKFILMNISLTRMLHANENTVFKKRIIVWLLKEADAVVCLAEVQRKYLLSQCPFLRGRVHVVLLGVDVGYYDAKRERRSFFLAAGRDNGRDYQTVVEVARSLPTYCFEIVCSKRNLEGIENIPENVSVFYDLHPRELKEKFELARGLLLITHSDDYTDGADCSGQTVLLEAMATGTPIIATQKEYMIDYARENEHLLLIDFYDKKGIIENIRLLDNAHLRSRLSIAARQHAEDLLSTKKMAKNLADVFRIVTYY